MTYTRPDDVNCPYCGHGQDINHDDGYGYTEDEIHEQECGKCGKNFGFETSISFNYDTKKVPCFNYGDCEWIQTSSTDSVERYGIAYYNCKHCGAEKREKVEETKQT